MLKIKFFIFFFFYFSAFYCSAGSESTVLFSSDTFPLLTHLRVPQSVSQAHDPSKHRSNLQSIHHVPRSAAELLPAPLNLVKTALGRCCSRSRPCGNGEELEKYKRIMRFQHNGKSQPAVRTSLTPSVAGSLVPDLATVELVC